MKQVVIDFLIVLLINIIAFIVILVIDTRQVKAADDWRLLDPKETSLEVKQFLPGGRDPLLTDGEKPNKEFDANFNTDVLKYGYWNNRIWGLEDQGQFRAVGWNWSLGVRLSRYLDVGYEHFSRHMLDRDTPPSWGGYPLSDSVNIKVYLYRRDKDVGDVLIK